MTAGLVEEKNLGKWARGPIHILATTLSCRAEPQRPHLRGPGQVYWKRELIMRKMVKSSGVSHPCDQVLSCREPILQQRITVMQKETMLFLIRKSKPPNLYTHWNVLGWRGKILGDFCCKAHQSLKKQKWFPRGKEISDLERGHWRKQLKEDDYQTKYSMQYSWILMSINYLLYIWELS